jgi:uncharacterized surface protein with fasciclin (FAS1) repeats
MYRLKKHHTLACCLFLSTAILFGGCKKDGTTNKPAEPLPGTLAYIQTTPRFSLLNHALTRAGLDKILAEGNVTVFAPADSAFLQAGWNKATIDQLTPDSVRFVMSYHIAPGIIGSENIAGFYKTFPLTLNEQHKPNVSKNYYGLFFNGNHIDHGNLKMGDGLIHELEAISFPPVDSLLPTLYRQPDLTIFSAAVKRFALLRNYIKRENITLLVPNDKAFLDSGYTVAKINAATGIDTVNLMKLCWAYIGSINLKKLYITDFIGTGKGIQTDYLTIPGVPGNARYLYDVSIDGTQLQPRYDELIRGTSGITVPPKFVRRNILSKGGIIHTLDLVFRPMK